ncbi:hypothetical protein CCACVL1_11709 [Corchorus capsularis]|uniref:Uncharacterized protein n=1 Tax=Corchorus capsularis TaxID=210143 RepID=A0A1R3IK16_COCAP|nr:hypothetical protein CCACVL1_11709 [Corchorus capsularis]
MAVEQNETRQFRARQGEREAKL